MRKRTAESALRLASWKARNLIRATVPPDALKAKVFDDANGIVAELTYLKTGEIERISAPTERDLALKLLVLKGEATIAVREAVRDRKLNGQRPASLGSIQRILHG